MQNSQDRQDLIAAALAAWAEGETASAIGARLGVTKNAISGIVTRAGANRSHASPTPPRSDPIDIFPPPGHCLFPSGDVGKPGFRFCGIPVAAPGAAWCAAHHARVYVKEQPKR